MALFSPKALPGLRARIAAGEAHTDHSGDAPTPAALRLRARVAADDPALRRAVNAVGITGADSVFLLVAASAFVNDLFVGCVLGVVYAVVTTVRTATLCNRVLAEPIAAQGDR
jgi:hypothetical protein